MTFAWDNLWLVLGLFVVAYLLVVALVLALLSRSQRRTRTICPACGSDALVLREHAGRRHLVCQSCTAVVR